MNNLAVNPMTDEQIQRVAPSAFAGQAYHKQSDRYAFVPTAAVIDGMRNAGFFPVRAEQSRTRVEGKRAFTKHMIRFRAADQNLQKVGDNAIESVLVNSHDGSSCYELSMGVFRLACMNGMMVSESLIQSIKVRHIGNIIDQIIEANTEMLKLAPKVVETITAWKTIQLAPAEQNIFAETAHMLRFEQDSDMAKAITPEKLLTVRRSQDGGNDLYTVFNRVQENVIRGGLRGRTPSFRRTRSREVKGIDQSNDLNRALWSLAEKMAALKS